MILKRCDNGHFYDAEGYSNCPHCFPSVANQFIPSFNQLGDGPLVPPVQKIAWNREVTLSDEQDTILKSSVAKVILFPDHAKVTHKVRYTPKSVREKIFVIDFPAMLPLDSVHIKAEKGLNCNGISQFSWRDTKDKTKILDDESRLQQLSGRYWFLQKQEKGLIRHVEKSSKRIGTIKELRVNYEQAEQMNLALSEERRELEKDITELREKLEKEKERAEWVYNGLELDVCAEPGNEYVLLIEYETDEAYWNPVYDIQSYTGSNKISFVLKAKIYQKMNIDWTDVNLLFSTGTKNNVRITELMPYRIVKHKAEPKPLSMSGLPLAELPAPGVCGDDTDELEDYTLGVYSDGEESERSDMQTQSRINAETGTAHKEYASSIKREFVMKETQTVSRGSQTTLVIHCIDKEIKRIFFAVPEKDSCEYMGIHVEELKEMNLLACTANIFLDGAYVGSKSIDPEKSDGLFVLGQAKGVTVTKRLVQEKTRSPFTKMQSVRTIQRRYVIKARNELGTKAVLRIIDQIPVTDEEGVRIENVRLGDACLEESTGYCHWNVTLEPGEERQIPMEYTICLPAQGEYEY